MVSKILDLDLIDKLLTKKQRLRKTYQIQLLLQLISSFIPAKLKKDGVGKYVKKVSQNHYYWIVPLVGIKMSSQPLQRVMIIMTNTMMLMNRKKHMEKTSMNKTKYKIKLECQCFDYCQTRVQTICRSTFDQA